MILMPQWLEDLYSCTVIVLLTLVGLLDDIVFFFFVQGYFRR